MTDRAEPKKKLSRRRFLGRLAAAGAGVAASALLPRVDLHLSEALRRQATAPPGQGFAFTADASHTGKIIRWGAGVAEAAGAGAAAPPGNAFNHLGFPYHVPATKQWIMVIDLARCDGCGDCQAACNRFHRVPPGQEWIKIYQLKDSRETAPYWFPRVCMQCDNPPCAKVCPVGATFKREDGIVLVDQERCIGCRFCLAACPYSARYFNWADPPETPQQKAKPYDLEMNMPHRRGVAEKCLFCPTLTRQGKLPACAGACTMDAIYFGDRSEDAVTNRSGETLKLSEVMKQGAFRYMEELGTEPRVFYLPPRNRVYPPPAAPPAR